MLLRNCYVSTTGDNVSQQFFNFTERNRALQWLLGLTVSPSNCLQLHTAYPTGITRHTFQEPKTK